MALRDTQFEADGERQRMKDVYAGYGADRRKRRAWALDNPGNLRIRDELAGAACRAAGGALRSEADALDVGCGTGWWLERLSGIGVTPSRLYGVDLLDERVAAAARRVPGACVRTGDARDLPFDDDSFGLVTMFTVLSAMGGPEMVNDALREVRRVARADGVALVWEPRTANPRNPATRLITKQAVARAWGEGCEAQTLTVVPALARALLGRGYHLLARIPPLRTHRLFVLRP